MRKKKAVLLTSLAIVLLLACAWLAATWCNSMYLDALRKGQPLSVDRIQIEGQGRVVTCTDSATIRALEDGMRNAEVWDPEPYEASEYIVTSYEIHIHLSGGCTAEAGVTAGRDNESLVLTDPVDMVSVRDLDYHMIRLASEPSTKWPDILRYLRTSIYRIKNDGGIPNKKAF